LIAARVRAFAKINLSLRVLQRRRDGYHDLETIFQSIALHDTITIRRTDGPFRLTCDDPACPIDDGNLVARAAAQVWHAAGRKGALRGISVDIVKRIPIQAGLGGGSSDCAAAIRAFGRLWRVPRKTQHEIGAALGADVPYFFEGGTALGTGRGDAIRRLADGPAAWVVVAVPPFGVSTADAFRWFDERPARAFALDRSEIERKGFNRAPINDLQAAVIERHPAIGRLIAALAASGASQAAMSGSGSAVFALFSRRAQAERAVADLRRRERRGTALLTRTLARDRYRRLAAN
jgi:4-diphosphocytidyl-2-C-methyl-D-erythritol kinase